jgi:hypothetical protein
VSWHFQNGIQVKNLVLIYKLNALRIQADEMSAVLSIFLSHAGIHAEQICIRAVDAFAQRYADLGYGDPAGIADREEIFTQRVIPAALQLMVALDKAEYPTAHENVGMSAMIRFNLL